MKRLAGIVPLLGILLASAYLLAATLASGEGESVVLINNLTIPHMLVFVFGLLGIAGGIVAALALLMDPTKSPPSPKEECTNLLLFLF
jgi:hypothetical protein